MRLPQAFRSASGLATPLAALATDRAALRAALSADAELHVYELGDLDDFFFPRCSFFEHRGEIALLYEGSDPPTLVALTRDPKGPMLELLRRLAAELPPRVYTHLTPGLAAALEPSLRGSPPDHHLKMALRDPQRLHGAPAVAGERLGPQHLPEVLAFYEAAYPDGWFVPRMLETGAYLGARDAGRLVAIAGVHVVSKEQRVAALGNVATLPSHRGRGLARGLCGRLCAELLADVDCIGLNVAVANAPAIACYRSLGFEIVAPYDEATFLRA